MPDENDPNTWLTQDRARISSYLNSADVIVLERTRIIQIIVDLFRYHFSEPAGLNILDLGCGDGILTKHLRDRWPANDFHLMDGSAEMIVHPKDLCHGHRFSGQDTSDPEPSHRRKRENPGCMPPFREKWLTIGNKKI